MTQEDVIKGLECCFDALVQDEHAFAENGIVMSSWQDRAKRIDAVREAIALLKAQEPKLVTDIHKEHNNVLNPNVPWVGKCPKCGKKIEGRNLTRFCKICGQAVKWE